MNKKREVYADILRIGAILIVIFIHAIANYRYKFFGINGRYYFSLTFIDSFTRIAVPIFFMITGTFMLPRTTERYSLYLKKRLPKLLIPFFLISIFYYFYKCNLLGINPTITNFFVNFFNGNIKYHFWFMYVIIIIYLLIPFIQKLVKNLNRKNLFSLIMLLAILSNGFYTIYLFSFRYEHVILKDIYLPSIFSYINYLLIGYYLYTYKITKNKKIILGIIGFICICLIPIADRLYINGGIDDEMLSPRSIFPIIPSIFTYIFIMNIFEKKKISKKIEAILNKISVCTIYIYMVHVYVLEKIEKMIFNNAKNENFFIILLQVVLTTLLTFIISLILSYIIVAIQNLIKKMMAKKQEKN